MAAARAIRRRHSTNGKWRHPVASSEALDVLHRAMRLASYRCIAMAIEIAIDLPAFFVAVDLLSPTTIAK